MSNRLGIPASLKSKSCPSCKTSGPRVQLAMHQTRVFFTSLAPAFKSSRVNGKVVPVTLVSKQRTTKKQKTLHADPTTPNFPGHLHSMVLRLPAVLVAFPDPILLGAWKHFRTTPPLRINLLFIKNPYRRFIHLLNFPLRISPSRKTNLPPLELARFPCDPISTTLKVL